MSLVLTKFSNKKYEKSSFPIVLLENSKFDKDFFRFQMFCSILKTTKTTISIGSQILCPFCMCLGG